jgi:hypothetical protein
MDILSSGPVSPNGEKQDDGEELKDDNSDDWDLI